MRSPVGAQLQNALLGKEAVLPHERQPAAKLARAAAVRNIAVAFNPQRIFGLDDLDRVVREIDDGAGRRVDAVLRRASAPGPEQKFEEHKGPSLGVVAAKADPGVAARLAREYPIGRDLGERAEQRVRYAEAG